MFRTPARDVHVHVWAAGSDDERRHVLFRDWLRVDEADRTLYEDTKRHLAGRRWRDMNYYAEAKAPVDHRHHEAGRGLGPPGGLAAGLRAPCESLARPTGRR